MGRKKRRGTHPAGVPGHGKPVAAASPGDETPTPLGVLWTPEPAPEEAPLAERIADVVREAEVASGVVSTGSDGAPVGVLWDWAPPESDPEPDPEPEVAPPPPPLPATLPVPPPTAPDPADEVTTVRPVFRLDPDVVLPPPAPLAPPILVEDEHTSLWLETPPAQPLPVRRRRGSKIAVLVAALAVCAALPWAVPAIPDLFADAVPDTSGTTGVVADPPIDPPTALPEPSAAPIKTLAGKRLASAGAPLEVVVPRLKVKSPVVPISGQSGELLPPSNPQLLGWWQEGTAVGTARGSAVVTGHTVSAGGGAFDHLGELVRGDRVKVRTATGTIEYVVRESRDVRVAELARTAEEIFNQSGDGRLVLITCSDFNGKVYLSNSVVYAVPVKDTPRR